MSLLQLGVGHKRGASPIPPVFTADPVMTMSGGTLDVGSTVTSTSGTVTGADLITYEWQADGGALYDDYGQLATNSTHVVQKGAQWKVLRCKVTATNVHGSTVAYSNDLGRVTIDFGEKTKSGWGAFPLGLGAVTITGGADASDFTISSGKLIPSGTKDAAKTFAASTYALTLSNGETLRIRIVPKSITIAVETSDTRDDNQLQRALYQTGANAPKLGWDVWMRDGFHNPTSAYFYIDIPSAGFAADIGTHVKVRSETVDYSLDGNGNPNNKHGGKIGPTTAYFDAAIDAKVLYLNTWHTTDVPSPPLTLYSRGGSNPGWGISFQDGRVDAGPSVTAPQDLWGLRLYGGCTVKGMVFTNIRHGINFFGSKTNGDCISEGNIFFEIYEDCHQTNGSNIKVRRNVAFNMKNYVGAHGDFFQHIGAAAGVTDDGIVIERNTVFRNNGVPGGLDWQHILIKDSAPTGRVTALIQNNVYYGTSAHGCSFGYAADIEVKYNTLLCDVLADTTLMDVTIYAIADFPGENGTFTGNVSNGFNVSAQTGTVISTPNPNRTLARTTTATFDAYPNLPQTLGTTMCNRVAMLSAARPADKLVASGGVKESDGVFNGAYFPNGALNDGSVYNPTDPTWAAAHPAAS